MKKQSKQHKICLWIKRWWFSGTILVGLAIAFLIICLPYLSPEHRITNDHTVLLWYLGSLAVTCGLFLCLPKIVTSSTKKYFITRVLVTGITGGVLALLLPVAVKSTTTGVGGLRHSILLATGGLIAIFTLGETRRKNDIDKKKNKQEKEKNNKDYQRQVRAERRERYTKAVEQLGDEKSTVRMGGVYTLVGLVDEWLEEKSLSDDQRLKEGQVIINNLCAYIRSPLTLASRANLQAEADVRLGIIKEIHDRLRGPKEETPGTWSDFEYDFSGSMFFYPVDLSYSYYLKSVNFSGSTYQNTADFSGSTYQNTASFGGSTYQRWANFSGSTYQGRVYFCGSTYQNTASFGGSTYLDRADFRGSTYWDEVDFGESTYLAWVDFGESTYLAWVYFGESTYLAWVYFGGSTYWDEVYFGGSTYWDWANFGDSTYQSEVYFYNSTYWGWADFRGSTYQSEVYFYNSTYWGWADFGGSTYWDWANFGDSTYWDWVDFSASIHRNIAIFSHSIYKGEAYFNASIFYQETYFSEDGYNRFSLFTDCAPQFYDETNHKYTLFGSLDNNFTVENGRGYPIYRNLEGLPLGCKFLTSEWREGLEDKFQEIEETNNKLLEAKYPKEKAKLSKKLRSLNEELHEWRDAITTVIVEICIISDQIIPREF